MHNCYQCAFITVPLARLMGFGVVALCASQLRLKPHLQTALSPGKAISIASKVWLKPHIQHYQLGLIEQANYLRQLWMFVSVPSSKKIASNFWSSSPNSNNSSNAWQLNFNNGNDNNNNRNNSNRVRLVRSGVRSGE